MTFSGEASEKACKAFGTALSAAESASGGPGLGGAGRSFRKPRPGPKPVPFVKETRGQLRRFEAVAQDFETLLADHSGLAGFTLAPATHAGVTGVGKPADRPGTHLCTCSQIAAAAGSVATLAGRKRLCQRGVQLGPRGPRPDEGMARQGVRQGMRAWQGRACDKSRASAVGCAGVKGSGHGKRCGGGSVVPAPRCAAQVVPLTPRASGRPWLPSTHRSAAGLGR